MQGQLGSVPLEVLLSALAQCSCDAQKQLMDKLHGWYRAMHRNEQLELVATLWMTKYDETPLKARISFEEGGRDEKDVHKAANVWCVEALWAIVVRLPKEGQHLFLLCGSFAPQLRATSNKIAEAIASCLKSCHQPTAGIERDYSVCFRLVDSDAAPSIHEAERILSSNDWQGWISLQSDCQCHKAHAAVTRAFDLHPKIKTGMKAVALQFNSSLPVVRQALKNIVAEKLVVVAGTPCLSFEAQQHRRQVIEMFTSAASKARAVLETHL